MLMNQSIMCNAIVKSMTWLYYSVGKLGGANGSLYITIYILLIPSICSKSYYSTEQMFLRVDQFLEPSLLNPCCRTGP
jgi:hypothetical protein